jgi:methionine biosynthesis protein MetW
VNLSLRVVNQLTSPDEDAAGLIEGTLNPLRYDGHVLDPDEVAGVVASMIPTGARVLDVGCGTGSVSEIVRDTCRAYIVGVEPDANRVERAVSRGLEVHAGYLSPELIREIGSFDVVLFADILEHLSNPHAMLLMCREALKPGGAVVVSVPNIAHWSVRVDLVRGKFRYQDCGIMDATHLRWFTAASARSLIASAGFKVTTYRATAGLTLADNVYRRPWRWLSENYRTRLLRLGCRRWPTLFGCQHVLKAEIL